MKHQSQGSVLKSGGDLQNCESFSEVVLRLVSVINKGKEAINRVSVHYSDHSYVVVKTEKGVIQVVKVRKGE